MTFRSLWDLSFWLDWVWWTLLPILWRWKGLGWCRSNVLKLSSSTTAITVLELWNLLSVSGPSKLLLSGNCYCYEFEWEFEQFILFFLSFCLQFFFINVWWPYSACSGLFPLYPKLHLFLLCIISLVFLIRDSAPLLVEIWHHFKVQTFKTSSERWFSELQMCIRTLGLEAPMQWRWVF